MKRLFRSVMVWTGFWFLCAIGFTLLATHRVIGRFDEPPPTLPWGKADNIRLTTADGEELGGWFFDNASSDANAPAILFLHGVGACRSQLVRVAEEFHRRGCSTLLITQRAHGDSTGRYNDFGFSCKNDVVAAVDWLRATKPGRPILVWGTSMGAASALFAAEENGDKVAGYVLECPYQNLRVATRNRTRLVLPPVVEHAAYHTLELIAPLTLPHLGDIDPAAAAAKMPRGIPTLILAGEHDRLATPGESHAIAKSIGDAAKVVIVPGGGHTFLLESNPELVRHEIDALIERIR